MTRFNDASICACRLLRYNPFRISMIEPQRHGFQPINEIAVLWITAGLGCDGESVALTAATQPALEDIVLGGIPGIPKVRFYNPFYSYENGSEFIALLEKAEGGASNPFILVIEGSIPNERIKDEGYW